MGLGSVQWRLVLSAARWTLPGSRTPLSEQLMAGGRQSWAAQARAAHSPVRGSRGWQLHRCGSRSPSSLSALFSIAEMLSAMLE